MRRRSTILLTGFGPFPGVPENASALLAAKLAHLTARRFPGHRAVARVLPTEWEAGPAYLSQIYVREHPSLALHFGVSERAGGFVIERRARNIRDPLEDATGARPAGTCVAEGGPATLAARIPADEIVARLRSLDLPAEVSDNAGAYLCNAVFYNALGLAGNGEGAARVGFVHIPAALAREPEERTDLGPKCALQWEGALQGGLEIVRACLGRPAPARVKPR